MEHGQNYNFRISEQLPLIETCLMFCLTISIARKYQYVFSCARYNKTLLKITKVKVI